VQRVSIIIPNCNHAPFLERRIRSVLEQTVGHCEVIFLDDASTDNSRAVYEKFAGRLRQPSRSGLSEADRSGTERPRPESVDLLVRSVFNDTNSGSPFRQWNKGVQLARGEYVWIAESDDVADGQFLERLVPLLDRHPKVGLACCASKLIDGAGDVIGETADWWKLLHPTRWRADFVNDGKDECARYLIHKNTIPNASAVLFRKSIYERAGGADETMRFCGDWMIWAKMLMLSDVAYVAEPLNFWRKHPETVTARLAHSGLHLAEQMQVVATIVGQADVPLEQRREAVDYLMKKWAKLVLNRGWRQPMRTHRRLYQIARQIDPMLPARVARRVLRHHLDTKPALAPLRPVARASARAARWVRGKG